MCPAYCDVLAIGAGNAALAVRWARAKAVVLERASPERWGGNSGYARNIRCGDHESDPRTVGRYREGLTAYLEVVTDSTSDVVPARLVVEVVAGNILATATVLALA